MASNVDVILRKLPEQMEAIKGHYARSLANREISDDLLHDIARFVEDCQRALDWTATDIDRKYGKARDRSPYYPMSDTATRFAAAMARDFPSVPQVIYDAMERHQPYQPGKKSLGYLHDLARVNKHQDFTPQTRTESRRISACSDGVVVTWDPGGTTFGDGVSIGGVPVDRGTQLPVPSPMQQVTETVYVGWRFLNPKVDVLPTLESLGRLVAEAVNDVRDAAAL